MGAKHPQLVVPGRGCEQEDGGHAGLDGSATTVQPGGPGLTGTVGAMMVVPISWKLWCGKYVGHSSGRKARATYKHGRYTNGTMNDACSGFTGSPEGSGGR